MSALRKSLVGPTKSLFEYRQINVPVDLTSIWLTRQKVQFQLNSFGSTKFCLSAYSVSEYEFCAILCADNVKIQSPMFLYKDNWNVP